MNEISINIETRSGTGKGSARSCRRGGKVPGIFYGTHTETAQPVMFATQETLKLRRASTNTLFSFTDPNGEARLAMVKDIQRDPVTGDFRHVDFMEVRKGERMKIRVPVVLTGKAKGVAEGGLLQHTRHQLQVWCFPTDIPTKIVADVTDLGLNESLHVQDIQLPEGVEPVGRVNYTLAIVSAKDEEKKAKGEGEDEAEEAVVE